MDKETKERIDHWIDTQKYGTIDEILALQNPQEYCSANDKPYFMNRILAENNAIQENKERQRKKELAGIERKYNHKVGLAH